MNNSITTSQDSRPNWPHRVERGAESAVRDLALNPKQDAIGAPGKQIALQTLEAMPARDREALIRFYLQEQTAQEIEAAMDMTDTQFRLIKSGARKRFAELRHRTAGLGFDPGGNAAISGLAISNRQRDPVPAQA